MNSNTYDFSTAIRVASVNEEYLYLRRNHCICGGVFRPIQQSLVRINESENYDVITVECSLCGKESVFIFDVSSFLGNR
jgi:hypothetical protein